MCKFTQNVYYFCKINCFYIKRLKKILIILLIVIGALPVAGYIAIQYPGIQTYIAKKVVEKLENKVNGNLEIEKVVVIFFNKVILKEVKVVGTPGDTLAHINSLSASVSISKLLQNKIHIKRLSIDGGSFAFITEGDKGESNLSRIFNLTSNNDTSRLVLPNLYASEIRIKNFKFNYKDNIKHGTIKVAPGCMDYTNIVASEIDIRINKGRIQDNVITAKIQKLAAKEQCGIEIKELSGDFTLNSNVTKIDNFVLKDKYSHIESEYLSFGYESGKDLSDFINKIILGANFKNALIDFRTIGYFAYELQKSNLSIIANGDVSGPICSLTSQFLSIYSSSNKTTIDLSLSITGLPDINKTVFDINIADAHTSLDDVAHQVGNFSGTRPIKELLTLTPGIRYRVQTHAKGTINNLIAKGRLTSGIGNASFNVAMKNKNEKLNLKGTISTDNLSIGSIIKNDLLGNVTLKTTFDGSINGKEGISVDIDSLHIDKIGFKGYEYSGIEAIGNYSNDKFDGRIICHDRNLDFLLQGVLSVHSKNKLYKFYLNVPYINLAELHLLDYKEIKSASFETMANLLVDTTNSFNGNIELNNIEISNDKGKNEFETIYIQAAKNDDKYSIDLSSEYFDLDLDSDDIPTKFFPKISDILLYEKFPLVFTKSEKEDKKAKGKAELSLLTHNTRPIFKCLMPNIYIADSTKIKLFVNEDDSLFCSLNSKRIGFGSNYLKYPLLTLNSADSSMNCNISSSEIYGAGISLKNNNINLHTEGGVIDFSYIFDNQSNSKNELEFTSDIFFSRDTLNNLETNIYINQSELFIQGYKWNFQPSEVVIGKESFSFKDFSLYNQDQNLSAQGKISRNPEDALNLNLNNFDLSIINTFFDNNIKLKGFFTGKVSVMDMYNNFGLLMDIKGNDVYLFDNSVGSLNIMSKWDPAKKRFNLLLNNKFQDNNPLNIYGYYKPDNKYLNANLSLKDFTLTYIEPFLSGFIENMSGSISGNMEISGPIDKLSLVSHNSKFTDFNFTPIFTKVNYTLNGDINFSESGVEFSNLKLNDQDGNIGKIYGGLSYRFFKNIRLDTHLDFKNLQILNSKESDNPLIYGNASGSGKIYINGPLNNIKMDAQIATIGKSEIHVPLSSSSSANNNNTLTFVNNKEVFIDPYEAEFGKKSNDTKNSTNFSIRAKANVSSDTKLFIEINKQLGDILKCNGHGIIDLNMNTEKDILDLRGDYTIDEGSYRFVILGITSKDFLLKPGGKISFNGGVMNTNLNVEAIYQTKSSVSTLISDTSSVGNRRIVNCGLAMSGKINNPKLKFSLEVPDLDPITKGRVESALSTEDKIQKQFMALLISGSFVPDQQSGIVNNSSILYSNAGEILSNQFNNIFRQLDIPLDLGLNYQKSDKGRDLFDVAVSYKAFNNRVIINGNVGNRKNSPNNWMGNFEAEIKLDKKGKMRLTAFTRATDDYSNYLDNSQRNGLGFTYQNEFDNIGEFFRSIFVSRKKREELEFKMIEDAKADILKEIEKSNKNRPALIKVKESPYKLY